MKAYGLGFIAAICTIIALNLAVTPGNAQVLYGSIVGNVLDSTNASVPDATVKITQKETNQTREGKTNAEGFYSFPTIPAGTYEVVVSKEGFQTVARSNVPLTINSVARVDLVLNVGVIAESVQVTAQAAVLQTDRAEVRSEVTSRTLENAPLPPGRNYENLFVTLPGFAPPSNFGPIPTNPSRTLAFSVNGASRSTVGLKIDGASSRSVWMRMNAAFSPSIDAIETVNVVTNSFDAEQGQAGGAAISVNIKSGTNSLHGSAYEYHTNNNLKARPYFLPANQGKPKMIMNQFGGTIGGPIKKNKLFYFVSYERLMDRRLADNNAGLFTVPTAAIRKGDMSGSSNLIYDPATGNPDGSGRAPFSGNQVPLARQDSIVTGKILPLLPLPTLETLTNNYYASGIARFNRNQVDSKVNWAAGSKLSVSGRFSITPWTVYSDAAFGDNKLGGSPLYNQAWTAGNSDGSVTNSTIAAVYVMSPTLIIDSNFGFTIEEYTELPGRSYEKIGLQYLGIPGTNGPREQDGGWPRFNVTSYAAMGIGQTNLPIWITDPQFVYAGNGNWTKGSHNIRFGGELSREHMNHWEPGSVRDTFTFSGGLTALKGGPSTNQYNSWADFLLGMPSGVSKVTPWDEMTSRTWTYSLYARDQWQASRKLTVSYGLRWEYFPMGTRADYGFHNYNFATNKLLIGGIGGNPIKAGIETSKKYFAPRLGVAYRPTDTFVVRAGFGITYDTWSIIRNLLSHYPVKTTWSAPVPNSYSAAGTLKTGIPSESAIKPDISKGVVDMPLDVSLTVPANPYVRPYIMSWNFTLQKELPWNLVGQAGYVASRTVHQAGRFNANSGRVLGAGLAGQPLYQKFGRTASTDIISPYGHATYDSLQASLEHRFSGGYQLMFGYTWSKAIQIGGDTLTDGAPYIQVPEYMKLNRNVSPLDVPHNFSFTGIAEMPFGRGKRWANGGGVPAALLGGWQVNSVLVLYSGEPFSVSAAGTSLNTPGSTQRADQVKQNVKYVKATGPGQSWFDPFTFQPVTSVRFGTAGFNTLRGPGTASLDLGLFRRFAIREGMGLEFRAEAFNATNSPHFSNPGSNVSSMVLNSDGTIRSLGGYTEINSVKAKGRDGIDERVFRFGLRLTF